ncbi:glycoside hydrolase family 125 protein [Trichocladium antarcticum]|uniref:Glycoside hydrolase family 125 protein n=1 Tax=Trichocladium antarcticum TaxID=1450529 RepID=A0AAN6UPD8_9PEZI|nr:glycoside hydrolase family 125 protein [Trichocladium antarcticum]
MVLPFINGSRRGRHLVVAALLVFTVFWLGYQTPLSTNRDDDLFDLHKDPPKSPTAHHDSDSPKPDNSHEQPTPPTSTNQAADNDIVSPDFEPPVVVVVSSATPTPTPTPIPAPFPTPTPGAKCVGFEALQQARPGPPSEGRRQFPYVRPPPECRTFSLPSMEALIKRMKDVIRDPDLFRLFENSYPNTLDTMVKWRGFAKNKNETSGEETATDEELAYIITGDIDAMWLRDSASQVYSYLPLLEASKEPDSLASLWRGLINSHSRYIIISPYCHSFQPPPESGISPTHNWAFHQNKPKPPYNPHLVFDCKWELDSVASFLQVSAAYHTRTGDLDFFGKYSWVDAVQAAVDASAAMRVGTYDKEGRVLPSAWAFTGWTNRGSETLTNNGLGNPVRENGMVRSAFRPSDDACIFQLLTPSNMMFAAYLEQASVIMQGLAEGDANPKAANLTVEMRKLAKTIRLGVALDAVVSHRDFGDIFAYEVDGYGGANLMDDANVPSLLAMPLWNYTAPAKPGSRMVQSWLTPRSNVTMARGNSTVARSNSTALEAKTTTADGDVETQHDYAKIYQNTRKFVLSMANPYYAKGPVLSAVGGPHLGPGKGWPMAAIVAALTAFEDLAGFSSLTERDAAVAEQLGAVLNSTDGMGVVHEAVDAWNEGDWSRSWFGWANGLFGELIVRIAEDEKVRGVEGTEESLLGRSWQD